VSRAALLSILLALAGCGGCRGGGSSGGEAPAAVDAAAIATPSADAGAGAAVVMAPPTPPPRLPCRVVLASPNVRIEDAGVLATAAEVPDGWVDLPAGAKMTAKDPRSARETNFAGPGRVRACVARDEEAWLAGGDFQSAPGSGERPGGEQWVVTPLGVVTYGAEDLRVHVQAGEVDVDAKGTHAHVWVLDGAVAGTGLQTIDVWSSMSAQHAALKPARPGSDPDLTNAFIAKCGDAADAAQELGVEISLPDASLGELAGKHVRARQVARAACAVARLRVSAMPDSPQKEAWTKATDAADARWREVSRRN
jgi:hypothetical protein